MERQPDEVLQRILLGAADIEAVTLKVATPEGDWSANVSATRGDGGDTLRRSRDKRSHEGVPLAALRAVWRLCMSFSEDAGVFGPIRGRTLNLHLRRREARASMDFASRIPAGRI